ncbi:MAG: hypothetical protein L6R00_07590 [Phycisphaerae bacterium]|nr:hypothetical protein [Phycisphaerae bacterium]
MFRRFIYAAAAFVFGLAAFFYFSRGDQPRTPPGDIESPGGIGDTTATAQPIRTLRAGELPVSAGTRPYFRVLDRYTGRVRYEFRTEKWEAVSEQLVRMERPDIRIHMPGGQITYITADSGEMEVATTTRQDVDPKRGRLQGNVKVVVDRTSRRWREANPQLAAMEDHPEQLIHIWLSDEARFDLEASRLTADGAVRMQSEEADIQANPGGESLVMRWNQVDNRIDYLTFTHGGRMELRRGGGMVDFAMPGAQRSEPDAGEVEAAAVSAGGAPAAQSETPPRDASALLTAEEAIAAIRAASPRSTTQDAPRQDENAPTTASDATSQPVDPLAFLNEEKRPERIETYNAVFVGDVHVEQREGLQNTGELDCDRLELVFDLGREQRRGGALGAPPKSQDVAATQPTAATAPAADDLQSTTKLVLEWRGPLELRPMDAEPAVRTGRRFDAIATGKRVAVKDRQGEAHCTQLVYRSEPSSVWLVGGGDAPARLTTGDGRELVADEIAFDRGAGRGRWLGKGLLKDPGGDGDALALPGALRDDAGRRSVGGERTPVEITWTNHVDFDLGRAPRRVVDEKTGQAKERRVDFIERAEFHGGVSMTQGHRHLGGEKIEMTFGPPRRPGALADHITRLEAAGDVALRDGDESIRAGSLDVDLIVTHDGRNVPTSAVADGAARVEQPGRTLAAEHVEAEFGESAAPPQPDDRRATRVRIRRLLAERKVVVRAQPDPLEIDGDRLDAQFDNRGELLAADIHGAGDSGWAYTSYADYSVNGRHVHIDVARQRVETPGRGHAAFVTRSDFDGRRLAEATVVNVTFTSGMVIDGIENNAMFQGRVHTSTPTHELQCERKLTLRLEDVKNENEAPPPDSPAADAAGTQPLAIVTRWINDRFQPQRIAPDEAPRLRKRPVFVLAEGDAAAVSTEYEPGGRVGSRVRIAGPSIEADLAREHLHVAGRGSLALEDYRVAPAARRSEPVAPVADARSAPAPELALPPLGGTRGRGPSLTAFFWVDSMSFDMKQALATFDHRVQMVHLSGDRILLMGDVAKALVADTDALRLGPGREAMLDADKLVVQFATAPASRTEAASPADSAGFGTLRLRDIRWNEPTRLNATGQVRLREGNRQLLGQSLSLDADNVVTLRGAPNQDALLWEESEAEQTSRTWRGPVITWNRTTGEIVAPQSRVTAR